MTYLICFVMNKIPHLSLRLENEAELLGTDMAQMGESAYYDFIENAVSNSPRPHDKNDGGEDIELKVVTEKAQ